MREPPLHLDPAYLRTTLQAEYQLVVQELTFLPLGHDSAAWVYEARDATGTRWFVKVRTAVSNPVSLLIPRFLRDHGLPVVAPIPTGAARLWADCAGYVVIVYPFIEGASALHQGLSAAQWRHYGEILRRIHDLAPPAALQQQLRRETFQPAGVATLRDLDAYLAAPPFADPLVQQLAAFWHSRQGLIHTLLERAEALGRQLAATAPTLVLCHADIHTNNVLAAPDGSLWVVDWDEVMLAPRERDLMFLIGGISAHFINPQQESWCRAGYGDVPVDPRALAYYRYAWAVSDIGAFADQVVRHVDLGQVSRVAALNACVGLFAPGEIVAIAQSSSG
ncbi:MAG: aminoglycoside phosphotransferase family protein [Oscillochloris sp.]|nr:aminoglycoside phosphotransferase family protein [Oscillochloris sp.]